MHLAGIGENNWIFIACALFTPPPYLHSSIPIDAGMSQWEMN